jgi:Mg2+ and Co2+ transporter CorA
MAADGHLLVILHDPPGPEEVERQGRFFWRQPDGTWHASQGKGPEALASYLEEYEQLLEGLEEQEKGAETARDYFEVLRDLAPLQRAARNMYLALQQARELAPRSKEIINLRDGAYANERMAELLYSDTKNSLDFVIAQRTEEQAAASHQMAASSHRLNVLVAFFFPIATLSAIFGVNMHFGLEEDMGNSIIPFVAMLALGLVTGFVLKSLITRQTPSTSRHEDEI